MGLTGSCGAPQTLTLSRAGEGAEAKMTRMTQGPLSCGLGARGSLLPDQFLVRAPEVSKLAAETRHS